MTDRTKGQIAEMTVLIAGASSGLGLHTARQLSKAGFTVIAGARSFREHEGEDGGMYRLGLDVRDSASVERFVRLAVERFGTPDALICAQGLLKLNAAEEYTDQELNDILDTNFIGSVRLIRQVMPLFREKKQGKIILFSSINGILGIPFQGGYTASKHAIEGYAECLRMEAEPFGVTVCLVTPGDHRSGQKQYRRHGASERPESPYHQRFLRAVSQVEHDESTGSDPDILGKRIARALRKRRLPERLLIAKPDQRLAVLLHKLLPIRLFSRIISGYYGQR